LFLFLKRIRQRPGSARRTMLYLVGFVVVLALPGCLLTPDGVLGMRVWGGWNIIEHLFLFILGYYAFSRPEITRSWLAYRYSFLVITVLLTIVNLYLFLHHTGFAFGTGAYALKIVLRAAVCLAWIFTFIGFAESKLNYTNSYLKYCNEAVLPFYIIHQPVIILIGYYIVQLQAPIGAKYLMIMVSSFIIVVALYEFLIRRVAVLRFLFGMSKAVRR